uniref:Uncharacterized protein n=1 Tax=Anguilla anguilla TaxID=7936 RepID=A0A0E9T1Y7_ANGAN
MSQGLHTAGTTHAPPNVLQFISKSYLWEIAMQLCALCVII